MTVFALALASSTGKAQKPDRCSECEPGSCRNIEFHVRQRARNWRIVLALGRQADNIPNVSFIDDERGCAELVCGVDIKGAAWLAKIWRPLQAAVRIEPSVCMQFRSTDVWPAPSRGWGVLPLDKSSFLRVNSLQELLGIPSNDVELTRRLMLNIGKCIQRIPNNPCIPERGEEVTGPMLNVEFDVVFGTDDMHDSDQEIPDAAGPSADVENTPADVEAAGADADIDVDAAGHEAELEGDDDAEDILVGGSSVASGETAQALPLDYVPGQQPAHPAAATILSLADPSAVLEGFTIWETPLEGMPAWYSGPGGSSAAPLAFLPNLYSALGAHADGSTASCVPEEGDDGLWSEGGGQDMAYYPHDGRICPIPRETFKLVTFLGGHLYHNELPLGIDDDLEIVFKRYRMLRLHEKELELRSFSPGSHPRSEYGVFCPEAMTMDQDMARATRSLFYATTRLSMVAHLPEISLVIIGSPIGRVLLVTPTQLPRPVAWRVGVVQHGFRVDWVLPRRSDEQNHRKTLRPLHGMAVGPVQEGGDRTSAPRRYRLMLHYRNHDILTYEISRDASSGKLYVF
ncbi:hypothetical protein RJ55_05165 [Drechmeria coniospora]|nr:hypothetical protein RJ55_05165 [Drechmeria coniospora]